MHGPSGIFWANLTPFSLQRTPLPPPPGSPSRPTTKLQHHTSARSQVTRARKLPTRRTHSAPALRAAPAGTPGGSADLGYVRPVYGDAAAAAAVAPGGGAPSAALRARMVALITVQPLTNWMIRGAIPSLVPFIAEELGLGA